MRWRPLLRLAAAGLAGFAALETTLRLFHHEILPQAVSNEVATGYHVGTDGIYDWRPEMKSIFMKPGYSRRMYYNGYRWQHRTDARGFRNPIERDAADVVLLGDSMIYGHGVEEEDTVRHHLEAQLGRPVANLGMQAACAHTEYQILTRHTFDLRPRYVFVFFLRNDIRDLTLFLSDEEMRRFVDAPADRRQVTYFEPSHRTARERVRDALSGSYALRAVGVAGLLAWREWLAPEPARAAPPLPASFREEPRMHLAMAFHLAAVKRMHAIAADRGVVLVHVFIDTTFRPEEERFFEHALSTYCAHEGIPFSSLREPLAAVWARGETPFLPHDRHFSGVGAAAAARAVADWIRAHEAGPAPATTVE